MKNYMDDSFLVADNTIITYSGADRTLEVPGSFAGIELSKIGDGSFMESSKLQSVVLPPETKEIGRQAFSQCPALTHVSVPGGLTNVGDNAFVLCQALQDITIYGLELTASEYRAYKAASSRSTDGTYVLRKMPENELVNKLVLSSVRVSPACRVPEGISSLFQMTESDGRKGTLFLEKTIPVIGFSVPSVPTTENEAFCRHIQSSAAEIYDGKTEQKNDWYVRVGEMPGTNRTIIFTFDDSKTREEKGTFFISITLKFGCFFWQSAQPVVYDKKKYYIYRRHYLSSDPEMEYVRRDIAVYSEKGLITNREEARNIYAKYRLMSIL